MGKLLKLRGLWPALLTVLVVSGCGFQLRGSVDLPKGVEPIYIADVGSSSQVVIELRKLLTAYGVTLTTEPKQANYQIAILEQRADKRTAAIGEGARITEYQLIETVSYQLLNEKKQTVLGPNTITERKIMPNDPNKVVSSSKEEAILRRDMLRNLAAKIARQLRAFKYPSSSTNDTANDSPTSNSSANSPADRS
jgi:LPS-assembly lipoprotein